MKVTVQVKLLPDPAQKTALLRTMEQFNLAASHAAKVGFEAKVFSQPSIHTRCYKELRSRYGLLAQFAVRAIGKAVECFARDKTRCPSFKKHSAVILDDRLFSFKDINRVSVSTLDGRIFVPFVVGDYHKARMGRLRGQADLVYRRETGQFFLLCTAELPDDAPVKPKGVIGVDLGIKNIAVDSDGNAHSGSAVEARRVRFLNLRRRLQAADTRSARRHLKRMSRKESLFRRDVNHCLSKRLVGCAKRTGRAIALEDLKGIRERTRVRAGQRARHAGWSFQQLRAFVEYKARLGGVMVVLVEARDTSRTCPACGHCDKQNRKSQAEFKCVRCGYAGRADHVAAWNIRHKGLLALHLPFSDFALAAVNRPIVATLAG
jgi:putative transposase